MVDQYGPEIFQWLVNQESPEKICTELSLCASKKRAVLQDNCSICELVLTYAESYLQLNGTVAELETDVDKLCAALPSPVNGECTAFVGKWLPLAVNWLVNNESPTQICQAFNLCPTTVHGKHHPKH